MTSRWLELPSGMRLELPLAMPVYQPKELPLAMERWAPEFGVQALILNAFFLYKDRAVRQRFEAGLQIQEHIGFSGCIMTDSGAFQGLKRPLYLDNRKIVAFQDRIGADIISPLDLITPPWDKRSAAEGKLVATHKRVRQALDLAEHGVVAGVQQGGRFRDLRQQSTDHLLGLGIRYLALGSLVPFFNRDHSLTFVGEVIRDARQQVGPDLPMHVYGAGDPVELPFMAALGADIFDSSAYGHYARGGWYMTPYGALKELDRLDEWRCPCPACEDGTTGILGEPVRLGAHNLHVVMATLSRIRVARQTGAMSALLEEVLERHGAWFPESGLPLSWEALGGD